MPILAIYEISTNYTFTIGEHRFGFMDAHHSDRGDVTLLCAGPFGTYYDVVPVSAATASITTGLLLATLLVTSTWICLRLRKASRRCS
jgi:hypothetical protein